MRSRPRALRAASRRKRRLRRLDPRGRPGPSGRAAWRRGLPASGRPHAAPLRRRARDRSADGRRRHDGHGDHAARAGGPPRLRLGAGIRCRLQWALVRHVPPLRPQPRRCPDNDADAARRQRRLVPLAAVARAGRGAASGLVPQLQPRSSACRADLPRPMSRPWDRRPGRAITSSPSPPSRAISALRSRTWARPSPRLPVAMLSRALFRRRRPPLYDNTPTDPYLCPGTFVFRPARSAYFHERPEDFPAADRLYHPVKPA